MAGMNTKEKLELMKEVKRPIVDYLKDQLKININALKAYETDSPIQDSDTEIRKMRELEAIKLRHSIYELERHISVIEKM